MAKQTTSYFGAEKKAVKVGDIVQLAKKEPLKLNCGTEIKNFPMAYQSYGKLNKNKSNAILVCHGLTGDQYAAGTHPVTGKPGWWENLIGPEKIIDTNKFFVISPNVIGGCLGSWGPKEINPKTKKPYNLDFPVITISDMVAAQKLLIEHLGIKQLCCVIGGSMGGMLTLEWATKYPDMVYSAMPIATSYRFTAQNIAFHEIGRQTIMADPEWAGGNYLNENCYPTRGLSVARMTAHVTYLSEAALHRKFGRSLQDRENISYGFDADFQIESYLRYQGINFVERFDPNSYLYITRAMDYFDLATDHGGILANAFKNTSTQFCIVSFSSDWLFPEKEVRTVVHALNASSATVSYIAIKTDKGHDAFLLDEPQFWKTMDGFLKKIAKQREIE